MKILMATDCYKLNTNGITTSVLALNSGLRRRGHEVKTLSLSDNHQSFRDGDDYYIRSFPAFYYPDLRISFTRKDSLLEELESWKPDIIHIHTDGSANRMAVQIMKQLRVPIVKTCHTYYDYYVFGKFSSVPPVKVISGVAGGWMYRHADIVTVPSCKSVNFPFLHSMRGRLIVIPNGIELDRYRNRFSVQERQAFRLSLGISSKTGVLVTVSRLSKEKNIRELITFFPGILKREPDVKYLIVGDGPDRKHLEKLAEKLQIQNSIIFTGRINPEDVWRYYAAADIYVADPAFEVHSMSYMEAMVNGLPLLCRADDSLNGVLQHGQNGLIWHSAEDYVNYACTLLTDPALRKDMSHRSLQKAEEFSGDSYAAAMLRVYEAAIHGTETSLT